MTVQQFVRELLLRFGLIDPDQAALKEKWDRLEAAERFQTQTANHDFSTRTEDACLEAQRLRAENEALQERDRAAVLESCQRRGRQFALDLIRLNLAVPAERQALERLATQCAVDDARDNTSSRWTTLATLMQSRKPHGLTREDACSGEAAKKWTLSEVN